MLASNLLSPVIIVVFVISRLISIIGEERSWTGLLPPDLAARLRLDPLAISLASTDFGNLSQALPAAVLYPSSIHDISALIQCSYSSHLPFPIKARGHGHSIHGQSLSSGGVIINMLSLNKGPRISVSSAATPGHYYADIGAEQLWIDVLHATLQHGLAPLSWTDYLYLTVGGTLSNAGISGQAFRHGPQITNVYEMDVITGKGEILTCSKHLNAELFHGVLGGLGQFGIITRARIALGPAPSRVRWMRLLYTEFSAFTRDQERLISMSGDGKEGFDYVEGSVVSDESLINNWRSSFFSPRDHGRICSLAAQHPIIYSLEVAKYYHDDPTAACVHQDVDLWIEGLSYVPGFAFENDVSFVEFLNRVRHGELKLRSKGLWDVPHPWLNLFVPGSRIRDFDAGVFKGILRKNASSTGPILVYPMNKNKWNEEMSAVTTDEEIFYSVGLLRSATKQNLESYQDQNREILRFCEKEGIEVKQYLPHYEAMDEWQKHFGAKWNKFLQRKRMFDPKGILEAGPMIFNKFS